MKRVQLLLFTLLTSLSLKAQSYEQAVENHNSSHYIGIGFIFAISFLIFSIFRRKLTKKADAEISMYIAALPALQTLAFGLVYIELIFGEYIIFYYDNELIYQLLVIVVQLLYGLFSIIWTLQIFKSYHFELFDLGSTRKWSEFISSCTSLLSLALIYPFLRMEYNYLGVTLLVLANAAIWWIYQKYKSITPFVIHTQASVQVNAQRVRESVMNQSVQSNKQIKQCPYCGEEILAVAQKCKHCGEWLKEEPVKEYVACPICGENIEKGTSECPYCHESVKI